MTVQVTDQSGNPLSGVAVALSGPVDRSAQTGQDGTTAFRSMRAGTYRLRFEHEGFITLERELTTRAQPADVSVALSAAPRPVKPVEPVAPPPPPPSAKPNRNVEPRTISLVDWVEKNLIKSEPIKSSLIACAEGGTATLLQIKDPMTEQTHADADEMVYVIAGEGFVRIRNQDVKMAPGSFALVPRGIPHTMRRDGRVRALIVLSVMAGAACADANAPIK